MNREAYLEKTKAQLDKWNADLTGLEAKAREAKIDAKSRYDSEIASIRARIHELQQKADEIRNANEDAWGDLKQGAEEAWNRVQTAVDRAMSEFK